MSVLFLITARGNSKSVPRKNIKPLAGKPLIHYSIEIARNFLKDDFICVSTDNDEIKHIVEKTGLTVPFRRPAKLSTDKAGSYPVIEHALDHYEKKGIRISCIVLLQPTSPFRKKEHIRAALDLYSQDTDMVLSVKPSEANPCFNLFVENQKGFLKLAQKGNYVRRQDCPPVYQSNGSIYVINPASLKKYSSLSEFPRVRKFVMDDIYSTDIDTPMDWAWAEFLIKNKLVTINTK
jgi:CMP-N,N'-diacetyllegionaminic acid synthase